MPLYEYYCSNCKSKFELLVSHQHADDVVCVRCHGEQVRRLLSIFALAGKAHEDNGYEDIEASTGDDCGCGGGSCGCH